MEGSLYPLKFKPIIKDTIWGGSRLKDQLGKSAGDSAGESWEISGVKDDVSVVSNGFLKGNSLQELIEIYMSDLVGEHIYVRFGEEFPLLIKFIDANDYLSIQVHPDDELARERHGSYGKTEMWYVMESEEGELIAGFNRELDKEKYLGHFKEGTLSDILNREKVSPGDIFFMPAGRVHAIGAGVMLAEIQQTSDVTYRIYDWDRVGADGKPREMHTELAVDAIDYSFHRNYRTDYKPLKNQGIPAVDCPYFTTSVIKMDKLVEKDFNMIDSFVIYICTEGEVGITYPGGVESLKKGETVLIPAELKNLAILPVEASTLLEVYIK